MINKEHPFINNKYTIDPFPYSSLTFKTRGITTFVFGIKKGTFSFNKKDLLFSLNRTSWEKDELVQVIIEHGWIDLIQKKFLPTNVLTKTFGIFTICEDLMTRKEFVQEIIKPKESYMVMVNNILLSKIEVFKQIVKTFNGKLNNSLLQAENDPNSVYKFTGKDEVKRLLFDFRHEAAIASGLNINHPRYSDLNENPCSVELKWRQDVKAYLEDPSRRDHYFLSAEWDWLYNPSGSQRLNYAVSQCCG